MSVRVVLLVCGDPTFGDMLSSLELAASACSLKLNSVAVEGYAWTSFLFLCLQYLMGGVGVRDVGVYLLCFVSAP